MPRPTPITDALALIERSANTGRKAHLPAELARALIGHPAYGMLVETRTQELIAGFRILPLPTARRKAVAAAPERSDDDGQEALDRARSYLDTRPRRRVRASNPS